MTDTTEVKQRICVNGLDPDLPVVVPPEELFEAEETDFIRSDSIREIGEGIIKAVKYNLRELATYRIRISYLWGKAEKKKNGRIVFGECIRESGRTAFFAECDYTIVIYAGSIRDYCLTNWQMQALVYHELRHVLIDIDDDGEVALKIIGHDVEMFYDEIRHFGLWKINLKSAARAFRQVPLFVDGQDDDGRQAGTDGGDYPGDPVGRVTSVTISSGKQSVTLTPETREAIDRHLEDLHRSGGRIYGPDGVEITNPDGVQGAVADLLDPSTPPDPIPTPESMAEELRSAGIPVKVNDQGDFVGPDGSLYDDKSAGWVAREAAAVRARREKSATPTTFANA